MIRKLRNVSYHYRRKNSISSREDKDRMTDEKRKDTVGCP
jgi:hypothetical protein